MRVYENIPYKKDGHPCHFIDLYLPDGECSALVLYLHGGGFVEGTRKDMDESHPFIRDMIDAGYGVANAEYRLYPEAKYPEFIEDAAAAVAFVRKELSEYCTYKKLIVCGCSAGGYMTGMLCFDRRYLEAVGLEPSDIDAYVHDAGQPTVHFNVLKEHGMDPRRVIIDERAPLYYVGNEEYYPPMQIIVSDNDIENREEELDLLVGAMRHFECDMSKVTFTKTNGSHVWYVNSVNGNGKSDYAKLIIPFIKSII